MLLKKRLHPPDSKETTQGLPIIQILHKPQEAVFPLLQHTGAKCKPCVSVGDKVKVGTLIADSDAYVSSPIHSSVSGEVLAIEPRPHPVLGKYESIVIGSDSGDTQEESIKDRENVQSLSQDEIVKIIRSSGIVGLGGAAFPAHVKLSPPKDKKIDTFIVNGAECEPFLTADHRLMLEYAKEIILGTELAMKVLGVSRAIVAIEENKPDAIGLFRKLVDPVRNEKISNGVDQKEIKVVSLKSFYPQGAEKQLINVVLNRQVPPGGLPFDVGVVVNNVATCFAIYEAVYKNKPLYERVLTLSGPLVRNPGNYRVKLGMSLKDVIDASGGMHKEPTKVIVGGPMMGIAQYTLDVPVIKGTSGILFFGKEEIETALSFPCIRCGRCLQTCPMGLNPSAIVRAIEKGRFDLAEEFHVLDCFECGSCSYVCPGNRNVVALVKLAKQKLKK